MDDEQRLEVRRRSWPVHDTWLRALLTGLVYFVAARYAVLLNDPASVGAGFWPGAGITLGALLVSPRRAWPAILTAAASAELLNDLSFGYGLGPIGFWVAANLVAPLAAAWSLQRWSADRLVTVRAIGKLLVVVGVAALLAGLVGALGTLSLGTGASYPIVVVNWAIGDALGMLTVAPSIVVLRDRAVRRALLRPEPLVVAVALAGITALVFELWQPAGWAPVLPYLVLPPLVWAAIRLRVPGAAVASLIAAQIANSATAVGRGPFNYGGLGDDTALIMLQLFLTTATVTALVLGARSSEAAAHARRLVDQTHRAREGEATAELYRRVLDEAPAAVFVKDGNGRYLLANLAVTDIVDRPRSAIIGRTDHELLPEVADRFAAADDEVRRTGARFETEDVVPGESGPRTYFTVRFPLSDPHTGDALVAGIATDVSERRELEQRLAMAERLETVGELAGGIAHDFNNLLIVIGGMTQLALDAIEADGDPVEPLQEVMHATSRASELGRQLLSFARRESLGPEGRCVPDEVVRHLRGLLQPLLQDHTTLRLDLRSGGLAVPLAGDRLEQLMLNLAVNARDAMPGGGRLRIETRRAEVHATLGQTVPPLQPGSYVRVTVTDSGTGMSPTVAEHALEPFFTTKAPGKGTGLGLASVYGNVTSAGGSMDIESEPGSGTTVRMWFPVAHEQEPAADMPLTEDLPSGDGQRILVVEDDPSVRDLVSRQLHLAGYVVHEAGSLAEVTDHLDDMGRLDLVVCDVVLTDSAGPEVVELVQLRQPSVPVLFMSGYTERTWTGRDRLVADEQLLRKPFTAVALSRAVAASLIASDSVDG